MESDLVVSLWSWRGQKMSEKMNCKNGLLILPYRSKCNSVFEPEHEVLQLYKKVKPKIIVLKSLKLGTLNFSVVSILSSLHKKAKTSY